MKRKIMILWVTIILSLVLCACSSGETNDLSVQEGITENEISTPSPTPEPTPTPKSESQINSELDTVFKNCAYYYDDFDEKYTYYSSQESISYTYKNNLKKTVLVMNPFQIYASRVGNECKFYVTLCYYGDSWIFFDLCEVKVGDQKYSIDLSSYKDNHKVSDTGSVYERYNPYIIEDSELYKAIRDIVDKQSGTIRFVGSKGNFTWELQPDSIAGMTEMMKAYDEVNEILQ